MTSAVQSSSSGTILSQASYVYDLFDRRITKNVNAQITNFYYQGNNVWKQANQSGTTHYLTNGEIDGWLARSNASGTNWYLTDRLGSVTGITNSTGALINSTAYDSFGHVLTESNPSVADSIGFTGREYDSETGLYYFRARYYNPDLGRFLSEDPLSFGAGDFNANRYVGNNPTNFFDSRGLDADEEAIVNAQNLKAAAKAQVTISKTALVSLQVSSRYTFAITIVTSGLASLISHGSVPGACESAIYLETRYFLAQGRAIYVLGSAAALETGDLPTQLAFDADYQSYVSNILITAGAAEIACSKL
jgi:RHS repeat-associated protein